MHCVYSIIISHKVEIPTGVISCDPNVVLVFFSQGGYTLSHPKHTALLEALMDTHNASVQLWVDEKVNLGRARSGS